MVHLPERLLIVQSSKLLHHADFRVYHSPNEFIVTLLSSMSGNACPSIMMLQPRAAIVQKLGVV